MILQNGSMRSARLREAVSPGLSYKAFADTVHGLQRKGFIERIERHGRGRRIKVLYELTDQGRVIVDLLVSVDGWAQAHSDDLPPTDSSSLQPARDNTNETPPHGLHTLDQT